MYQQDPMARMNAALWQKFGPIWMQVEPWIPYLYVAAFLLFVAGISLFTWLRRPRKPKHKIESGIATKDDLIRLGYLPDKSWKAKARAALKGLPRTYRKAAWATWWQGVTAKPVTARDMTKPGGLPIGEFDGHILIDKTPRHIRYVGIQGSGKSWSFLMLAICRTWVHSILGVDIKGELSKLAQWTRFWRPNIILDPLNPETACFNPFNELPDSEDQVAMAQNLAGAFPDNPDRGDQGGDKIWDANSTAYVGAGIVYVNNFFPDCDKNLVGLMKLMAMGKQAGVLMMGNQHPNDFVRDYIRRGAERLWNNDNERYVGSITATIDMYLRFYEDARLAHMVSRSDFLIEDLQCGPKPIALWQVIRDSDRERMGPIQRMIRQCVRFKLRSHEKHGRSGLPKKWWLLGVEDEFNQGGVDRDFEKSLPLMRSYMQRWCFALQSDKKLKTMYGAGNLIQDTSRLVTFKVMEVETADDIAKRFKQVPRMVESAGTSYDKFNHRAGESANFSFQMHTERSSWDMMTMGPGEVYVFGDDKVIHTKRPSLDFWQPLVRPTPRSWEPELDMDTYPLRDGDGVYINLPRPHTDNINHWHGINYTPPAPPPANDAGDAPTDADTAGEPEDGLDIPDLGTPSWGVPPEEVGFDFPPMPETPPPGQLNLLPDDNDEHLAGATDQPKPKRKRKMA